MSAPPDPAHPSAQASASGPALHGRRLECAALDRVLHSAQAGAGGAIVITGEPGIGKSTLLDYTAGLAGEMRTLRVRGVQAESGLAFAGLHALLRPVLPELIRSTSYPAAALQSALGLIKADPPGRFLVFAGLLHLLSELAEQQPLLCLVDDIHLLDPSSVDALAFSARRIRGNPIALVLAGSATQSRLTELPQLPLAALDGVAARTLLIDRSGPPLDSRTRERLISFARGNPLALVELSDAAGRERGGELLHSGTALSARLSRAFLRRSQKLPTTTQRMLLVAAAEDAGDLATVLAAAEALRISSSALIPAERARLVRADATMIDFVHPLVRSAIYEAAPFVERQLVHRALAGVLTGAPDERATWHRAAAALFPNPEVAQELEQAAVLAHTRGAQEVAAMALERAAALTADRHRQTRLLLDAAESAFEAGNSEHAAGMVNRAERGTTDAEQRGRVQHLRGRLEVVGADPLTGYEILSAAAAAVAPADPRRAAAMLVEAVRVASYAGDLARTAAAGHRAMALFPAPEAPVEVALVAGIADVLCKHPDRGAPLLRAATLQATLRDEPAVLLWAGVAALYLGDRPAAGRLGSRAVALARTAGAQLTLCRALELQSAIEFPTNPSRAEVLAAEGLQLARDTRQPGSEVVHLINLATVAALRGQEEQVLSSTNQVLDLADRRCLRFWSDKASAVLAALDLALGQPAKALLRLESLSARGAHLGLAVAAAPDLVEAAVRAGEPARGQAALDLLRGWARCTPTRDARALVARSQAMLGTDDPSSYYEEALRLHPADCHHNIDRARTELLYGEFLRRNRRRVQAREHLWAALQAFERWGAVPWTERARVELRACGEIGRRPNTAPVAELTPQERQIAQLAAGGAANKEIALQLFLSPRTVDYHLRKVFTKLGISARGQLRTHQLAG